jgi:antitoxin component of MazEF toxin-antitoxin module
MKVKGSVLKSGNSLVVVVPAPFTRKLGIRRGDEVEVEVDYQKGQATYTFLNVRQLSLV